MTDGETPLDGGNMSSGVVRVGDTVRRRRALDRAVHALLTHLHVAGFHGAPWPLGIDERGRDDGMAIPEELERREERLAAIAAAKAKIEARVQEREQVAYEEKLAAREKRPGQKPRGRPPQPPSGAVEAKEQLIYGRGLADHAGARRRL